MPNCQLCGEEMEADWDLNKTMKYPPAIHYKCRGLPSAPVWFECGHYVHDPMDECKVCRRAKGPMYHPAVPSYFSRAKSPKDKDLLVAAIPQTTCTGDENDCVTCEARNGIVAPVVK